MREALAQHEIILRVHAELRNHDTYVMAGKRCIEQRGHYNEEQARDYLAEKWGLIPKHIRRKGARNA